MCGGGWGVCVQVKRAEQVIAAQQVRVRVRVQGAGWCRCGCGEVCAWGAGAAARVVDGCLWTEVSPRTPRGAPQGRRARRIL